MTGGDATRVGDVLTIRNGKTVEVLNTDAEGRLVLADAPRRSPARPSPTPSSTSPRSPARAMVALGNKVAGLMGNNDALGRRRCARPRRPAGERVWPLPLPEDYRSAPRLRGRRHEEHRQARQRAAPSSPALFLQEFVGEGIPWAHLDIAGAGLDRGRRRRVHQGGTGFGVRLLLELARTFKRPRRR